MLRINVENDEGTSVTLRLEGRLVGEWATELERECQRWLERRLRLSLDFADVRFVDSAGARLLQRLRSEGIEISNMSGLIQNLIQNHRVEGS